MLQVQKYCKIKRLYQKTKGLDFIKKFNAAAALTAAVLISIHIVLEACLMFGFFAFFPEINYITRAAAAVFIIHAVSSLIIFFFFTEHGGFSGVAKYNRATIIQRVSALLLILMIHLHGSLSWFILPMAVFVCVHLAVSVPRGMITLGITKSEKSIAAMQKFSYIFFAALLVFASAGVCVYMTGNCV